MRCSRFWTEPLVLRGKGLMSADIMCSLMFPSPESLFYHSFPTLGTLMGFQELLDSVSYIGRRQLLVILRHHRALVEAPDSHDAQCCSIVWFGLYTVS